MRFGVFSGGQSGVFLMVMFRPCAAQGAQSTREWCNPCGCRSANFRLGPADRLLARFHGGRAATSQEIAIGKDQAFA